MVNFCGWLAVFRENTNRSSFARVGTPPDGPYLPDSPRLGLWGQCSTINDRPKGWMLLSSRTGYALPGCGNLWKSYFLLSFSFLFCKNKGCILNDLSGTSQLPGFVSSSSIHGSFTKWSPEQKNGARSLKSSPISFFQWKGNLAHKGIWSSFLWLFSLNSEPDVLLFGSLQHTYSKFFIWLLQF